MPSTRPGRPFTADPHVRLLLEQDRQRGQALARYARWERWPHAPYRVFHARWVAACDAAAAASDPGLTSRGVSDALLEMVECLRAARRHWRNVHRWYYADSSGQARAWDTAPHLVEWGRTSGRFEVDIGPDRPGCLAGPLFPGQAPETSALLALLRTAAFAQGDLPRHVEFQCGRPLGLAPLADWLRLLRDVLLPPPDARDGRDWARQLVLPPSADDLAVRVTAGEVGRLMADRTAWAELLTRLAPKKSTDESISARMSAPPSDSCGAGKASATHPTVDTPPQVKTKPKPKGRTAKPPPPHYVTIRKLHTEYGKTRGQIVNYLGTTAGIDLAKKVDTDLKAKPLKPNGDRRERKDVVHAALSIFSHPRAN